MYTERLVIEKDQNAGSRCHSVNNRGSVWEWDDCFTVGK